MSTGLIVLDMIVGLLAIGAGLLIKWWLDSDTSNDLQISWGEFFVGSVVVVPLIMLVVGGIGWKLAWDNTVTYHENWNGWELSTNLQVVDCNRDGPCYHEYSCDPYTVMVSYSCGKDNKDTCYRNETRYHDCPYVTQEIITTVNTTLGVYTIDDHVFTSHPLEWRAGSGIIGGVPQGPSQFWLNAKARCDAGKPGPVTKRMDYVNYILASDATILKQYSDQIQSYKDANLLPPVSNQVRDYYYEDRVKFVGFVPQDPNAWQNAVAYLNAAFGTELQGDFHLVIVQSSAVDTSPDAYITALKAYWMDSTVFGKDAISKNGVIIVLGTDGKTITWARAQTGMPIGNEPMMTGIQSFFRENQVNLTPDEVIGPVIGQFYEKTNPDTGEKKIKVKGVGDSGALRQLLWGLKNPSTKFVRVSMSADQATDTGGGFKYLASEIEPSAGQKWMIGIISFVFCLIGWYVFAQIGDTKDLPWRRNSYYR